MPCPATPFRLAEALAWLKAQSRPAPPETIPLAQAAGRVLAAGSELVQRPPCPTAAIDGIAVLAAATEGTSDYAPLTIPGTQLSAGDPMPPYADAVLPPHAYQDGAVTMPVARGTHVRAPGHDVPAGAHLPPGTRLAPLHVALLHADPSVLARPRVAAPGHAVWQALLAEHGAILTPDDPALVLLDTPGFTTLIAPSLALCPGEATAIGLVGTTPAIMLPPHPADAATVFALLVAPLFRHLAGLPEPLPREGRLSRKITSSLGQLDAVRVRLEGSAATPLGPADGTGLLAATAADGLVLVPEGSEGYPPGSIVPIFPL